MDSKLDLYLESLYQQLVADSRLFGQRYRLTAQGFVRRDPSPTTSSDAPTHRPSKDSP